ncbi:hypothetical protein SUGI_0436100 [Cryptomeria japonica]|nr:hypothetical protein SUGI_0436100 [Cryptomeria japonica]
MGGNSRCTTRASIGYTTPNHLIRKIGNGLSCCVHLWFFLVLIFEVPRISQNEEDLGSLYIPYSYKFDCYYGKS